MIRAESLISTRTVNAIRDVVDSLRIPKEEPNKKMIPLSLGDPTCFGNLKTTDVLIREIQKAASDLSAHGYQHTAGSMKAREAVAKRQAKVTGRNVTGNDVTIASGCSGALDIAIKAFCSPGDTILLPQPGFPLYETLAQSHGVNVKFYPLLPDQQWEIDVEALEGLVDETTRCVLINNPSNPCGSVYSKEHLQEVLAVAERCRIAVIADEIYGNLVFSGVEFCPMAALSTTVPIVEVGGLAKEFLVPGFRIGWLVIYDVELGNGSSVLMNVRRAIHKLTQLTLGGNTLLQACMPAILTPEAGSKDERDLEQFNVDTIAELEKNANYLVKRLSKIPGLRVGKAQGAMYVMVEIDQTIIPMNDVKFTQQLVDEELVFVLPGSCFGLKNFVRIVFCAPEKVLKDACERIESFVERVISLSDDSGSD